jgi:uncharacterized membrane protein AbrB (regulator of aidB expression)
MIMNNITEQVITVVAMIVVGIVWGITLRKLYVNEMFIGFVALFVGLMLASAIAPLAVKAYGVDWVRFSLYSLLYLVVIFLCPIVFRKYNHLFSTDSKNKPIIEDNWWDRL